MFEILWSYSSAKNLDFSLCKEICFFSAYTSDDKYTEKEIKIQASPSFWRGIYRRTPHLKFWQFVAIRWFFLTYISSFCMAADPRMTKAITTTTKKKNKYKNIIVTSFKQLQNNVITHYTVSCKYTSKPQEPQGVCHTDRGRRRKELDRISICAARLKITLFMYMYLSFTQSRMQIKTAHTGHRNILWIYAYSKVWHSTRV